MPRRAMVSLRFPGRTTYPGGSASVKEEVDARPAHESDGTSAVMGTGGEALPVLCESDDGEVQLGAGNIVTLLVYFL